MLPSLTVLQDTLTAGDLPALLADLDRLRGRPDTAAAAIALYDALNAAAHILSADPAQLAGQLLGRLRADDSPHLARLLAEARAWRGAPWLRPLAATLAAPGTPLIRTIPGERRIQYTDIVVPADGRRVLAGTTGSQLLYWDITTGGWQPRCLDRRRRNLAALGSPTGHNNRQL